VHATIELDVGLDGMVVQPIVTCDGPQSVTTDVP